MNYLLWLQRIREALGPVFENLLNGISYLSTAAIFVLLVIYWCFHKKTGEFALLCYGIGQTLNQTLKAILCVQRPWILNELIKPSEKAIKSATGYSFPSGHSESSFAAYGALVLKKFGKTPMTIGLVILICLIGLSRNFLGVHTLQDVLAGFGVGLISILIVYALERNYGKYNDKMISFIGLAAVSFMSIYVLLKGYSGSEEQALLMKIDAMKAYGFMAGCIISFFLEKNYVNFDTEEMTKKKCVIRLCTGLLMVLPVYLFSVDVLRLFANEMAAQWLRTFITAVVAIGLVPLVFKRLEKM